MSILTFSRYIILFHSSKNFSPYLPKKPLDTENSTHDTHPIQRIRLLQPFLPRLVHLRHDPLRFGQSLAQFLRFLRKRQLSIGILQRSWCNIIYYWSLRLTWKPNSRFTSYLVHCSIMTFSYVSLGNEWANIFSSLAIFLLFQAGMKLETNNSHRFSRASRYIFRQLLKSLEYC